MRFLKSLAVAFAALVMFTGAAYAIPVSTLVGAEGNRTFDVFGNSLDPTGTFFGNDRDLDFTGPGFAANRLGNGGSDVLSFVLNPALKYDVIFALTESSRGGEFPVSVNFSGTDGVGGTSLFNVTGVATLNNPIETIILNDIMSVGGSLLINLTSGLNFADVDTSVKVSAVPLPTSLTMMLAALLLGFGVIGGHKKS